MHKKVDGFAVSDKKAPSYIRKAYKSWADQRQRCNNPNDPRYPWWGAKGICVEYTAYEFVAWWKTQWFAKGPFKRANCSRIDHKKNYTLDNIELVECSENCRERIDRAGAPGGEGFKIKATHFLTGEVRLFESAFAASRALKMAKSAILSQLHKPLRGIPTRLWVFTRH